MTTSASPSAPIRRRALLASGAVLATAPLCALAADPWPSRPIKLIHAFAPGSVTDNTGRMLAEGLTSRLGQAVVVENRPGANMIIGTEFAAKQPADGHTMVIVTCDNMAINPNLYRNAGYRHSDFDPLTLIGPLPMALVAPPNSPYNSFADIKAAFDKNRKPLSFGTWGVGSLAHMIGELIRMETGIVMDYVPFQGATPATASLLGGHIDLTFNGTGAVSDLLKSGKVKVIAVGGSARAPDLPQVPTFAELGYPNIRATQWHGISARAGGRREIIDRLYREITAILAEPRAREQLGKAGYSRIDGRSPAEFAKFVESEAELWARVVKLSGATADR